MDRTYLCIWDELYWSSVADSQGNGVVATATEIAKIKRNEGLC
jgi:hypothetical protein